MWKIRAISLVFQKVKHYKRKCYFYFLGYKIISFFFYCIFFNLNLFILIGGELLYSIVLVLPYINMHLPRVYTCSPSWTPVPPPSPYHHSGSSQCTSPKLPVSCIEPGLVIRFLYDILYMLQYHSPQSSHPSPLPQSPKDCSIHLCLYCCLATPRKPELKETRVPQWSSHS